MMVVGESAGSTVDVVVADSVRAAGGAARLPRPVFDDIVAKHQVPARSYRHVLEGVRSAGLVIIDQADQPVTESDPDPPSPGAGLGPGWDADGFDHFIRSNWHEVLTPEAEHALALDAQRGLLAQQALEDEGLPDDPMTQRRLQRDVRAGKQAEDELIRANLRLVMSIVGRMRSQMGPAVDMEDLFQEGVLGLGHAITKFDPDRGFKLSTYATWWIRQATSRAIADKRRVIRLPVHKHEQVRKVTSAAVAIRGAGKDPTPEAIARRLHLTTRAVEECLALAHPVTSLDRRVRPGRASTIAELLADPAADPSDMMVASVQADEVRAVLDQLSQRERTVLTLRFGLDDGQPRTLEEVGREFGVTRERIRQIEKRSLDKLRSPSVLRRLRESAVAPTGA